jgi:hypothetical protein
MKGKIEDVIPTCQFGNRHITMEFDNEADLEQVLSKMNELYRKYHNFIGKKPEEPKKAYKPLPQWNPETKRYEEVKS